jgi:malonyl-CoA/methylmalonyl-CoA synthetase
VLASRARPGVAQTHRVSDPTASPAYDALFGSAARAEPARPCLLLGDDEVMTYADVDDRAARFAAVLQERGVGAGDRVVVQVDKSVDAVALYLGCLRAGAVHVPLNPAHTGAEVAFGVTDAGAAIFVGRPGGGAGGLPSGCVAETLGTAGDGSLAAAASEIRPQSDPVARQRSEPAAMLYTSGTTGRPKGAVLSGGNLVANAEALVEAWRFQRDDVLVHVLPVFHVHGLFVALHCAFAVGAAVRLHERFDVEAVRRDLRRSTVLMGVPTHYHRLLADPGFGADDCQTMRLFTSGSAPLAAADHVGFEERTGYRIVERYGMTETLILTSNPYDGERVAGTVGFPLRGVELRVTGDAGGRAPSGEPGSVEVRGDGVFLGYRGLEEQTAAAYTDDGWFVTGDIGALDAEGRLTLVGRTSDLVISGGYNVYPKEVEAVLDSVSGVVESAVVGVGDPDLGEVVVAAVVLGDGAAVDEDLLAAACEGVLARYKHPRRYVWLDELPRNAMGKVQKAAIRQSLDGPTSSGERG